MKHGEKDEADAPRRAGDRDPALGHRAAQALRAQFAHPQPRPGRGDRQEHRAVRFTNPVLAGEDGTIIAGHGRVTAAQSLGIKIVPVIMAADWSEQERRAYVIADNKLALDAGWDEDLLKLELGELAGEGVDLEITGFSEADLNNLLGNVDQEVAAGEPDTSAQLEGLSYSVVIRCESEQQQGELLEEFDKRGLKAEALIS
jgi:ParB-like chromosome segregation protein Spo0J